jgi:hypothetical protein
MLISFVVFCFIVYALRIGKIYQYRKKAKLFSASEKVFLSVLEQAVHNDYRVLTKVCVAHILAPDKTVNRAHRQTSLDKISTKYFDYILCDKDSLAVIAVIIVDSKFRNIKEFAARDRFLEEACLSAKLKLVLFDTKTSYSILEVKEKINAILNPNTKSKYPYHV